MFVLQSKMTKAASENRDIMSLCRQNTTYIIVARSSGLIGGCGIVIKNPDLHRASICAQLE
jgi:hypothetical protein